jgi:hypothetical protein
MTRKLFLSIVAFIAVAVGSFALFAPALLLEGKGVLPSAAASVWVRQAGVLIMASGIMAFLVRGHADSPTLRAFLIGNAVLQLGIFPIEIFAYTQGIITKVSGIVPNEVLHLVLAAGFLYYAAKVREPASRAVRATSGVK